MVELNEIVVSAYAIDFAILFRLLIFAGRRPYPAQSTAVAHRTVLRTRLDFHCLYCIVMYCVGTLLECVSKRGPPLPMCTLMTWIYASHWLINCWIDVAIAVYEKLGPIMLWLWIHILDLKNCVFLKVYLDLTVKQHCKIMILILTHYRTAMPFGNRNIYCRGSYQLRTFTI